MMSPVEGIIDSRWRRVSTDPYDRPRATAAHGSVFHFNRIRALINQFRTFHLLIFRRVDVHRSTK